MSAVVWRHLWLLCVQAVSLLAATQAWAQADIETQVSARTVEVGQPFQVELKATSQAQPESPALKLPAGFQVAGPRVGTTRQFSFGTGRGMQSSIGLTATWQVTASKVGTFTLGPASVETPAGRIAGSPMQIKVVPAGTLPQSPPKRRRRRGLDPFDPFDDDLLPRLGPGRSLFDDIFGDPRLQSQPNAPPEYQLQHAPDPVAFLRAEAEPKQVVVGQQVTLRIYAYGSRGRFNESNSKEPRRPNFYSHSLIDRVGKQPIYLTEIDGTSYHTVKVREIALFPLAAGRQEIGPMTMNFYGSRYISAQFPEGIERQSQPLFVNVIEPPASGRPPGYQLGDVGSFELNASVAPRNVQAGGSISVQVTVKGIGNLPEQVQTPDQHGVEWLNPTVTEQLRAYDDERIGGSRTFQHVVRLNKPGDIDLGTLKLPFFDPNTGSYRTATAELGVVKVTPNSTQKPEDEAVEATKLSTLAKPRELREYTPTTHATDRPWFWALLLCAPLGVVLTQAGQRFWATARQRRRQKLDSGWQLAKDALGAADKARKASDVAGALGHIERALFAALEAATSLRARALLREELKPALTRAGLSSTLAAEVHALLQANDDLRFSGSDAASADQITQLQQRTKTLIKQLKEVSAA